MNFSFLGVAARDILDILVVAILIYAIIMLFKKAHSLFLFNGIAVLAFIYLAARYLNLYLTSLLFSAFFGFFVIIFAVVFQREIRRFFEWLSEWRRFPYSKRELIPDIVSTHIIQTVEELASTRTGALIVFPGEDRIDLFTEGGIILNGRVSAPLLLSIFDTSSPGHDGAVIIQGDRVRSFGVHLPLAKNFESIKKFGTRHRAALGLAERSDALIIAVSEEKGTISVAEDGTIQILKDATELAFRVHDFLSRHLLEDTSMAKRWNPFINFKEKTVAGILAVFLWYAFVIQLGAGTITRNFDIPIEFRSLPENEIIDKINPVEISVSLSGSNQDFSFLNPDRLKVIVDLSEVANGVNEGQHKFSPKDKDIVNLPGSLSVLQISPASIQFSIKQKTASSLSPAPTQ